MLRSDPNVGNRRFGPCARVVAGAVSHLESKRSKNWAGVSTLQRDERTLAPALPPKTLDDGLPNELG